MRLKTSELVAVFRELAALVAAGDSFEGSLEYHIAGPDTYEVSGSYRFGNSDGQGAVRLLQPTPGEEP